MKLILTRHVVTCANDSCRSKAFRGVFVCVCVCVCPHDKTKMAETTITNLPRGYSITSPRPSVTVLLLLCLMVFYSFY